MIELWIYRGLVGIMIPIISFGLYRWIASMDKLTASVTGILNYISTQDYKNEMFDESIKANQSEHKEINTRILQLEKDIIKLKASNPEYLNPPKRT